MQTIRLSTVPGVVNAGVNLSQYDVGRQIGFLLYDESGAYTPPAGATAKIRATKPSGFAFDVAGTISGNMVTVEITETMSAESGVFPAEIRITKDSGILGTANFLWHVERAPRLEGSIDGDAEARSLMQDLLDAEAAATSAATAAGSAATAANAAATDANAAAAAANTAAEQAEAAAADVGDAADRAEAAADEATAAAAAARASALDVSAEGDVVTIYDGAADADIIELIGFIEPLQAGTGDPSLSNPRTISGRTGMNISTTGKNIFDETDADWKLNYLINASGAESSNSSYKYSQLYTRVKPETEYTVQFNKGASSSLACTVACYTKGLAFISRETVISATSQTGDLSGSFTTPAGCEYIRINVPKNNTTYIQIEAGGEKTDYQAFGEYTPVSWQTAAGTVYAGVLNATTGVLTVTHAIMDMGDFVPRLEPVDHVFRMDLSGRKYGPDEVGWSSASAFVGSGVSMANIPDKSFAFSSAADMVLIRDDDYSSIAAFLAAYAGQKLVYPVATPTTYNITPEEFKTMKLLNTMWTDAGPMAVTYYADLKAYIATHGGGGGAGAVTQDTAGYLLLSPDEEE